MLMRHDGGNVLKSQDSCEGAQGVTTKNDGMCIFSWTDRPFTQPFLIVCPHAQDNFISPVVDHLHFTTRLIRALGWESLTRSRLTNSQNRSEHQDKSH
jgi:hypothetical protein